MTLSIQAPSLSCSRTDRGRVKLVRVDSHRMATMKLLLRPSPKIWSRRQPGFGFADGPTLDFNGEMLISFVGADATEALFT